MSLALRLETVKRAVPTPLKQAIKTGSRALYYAPLSRRLPLGISDRGLQEMFPKTGDVFLRYLKQAELRQLARESNWRCCCCRNALGEHAGPWYASMLV